MDIKTEIESFLRSTERAGIEDLLEYMEQSGFYTAPASTKYHGATEGALAVHSFNVLYTALNLATAWLGENIDEDFKNSIVIVSLLHDLGKAGQFGKPLYIDNMLKTGQSKAQPYKTNEELLKVPHEVVSVVEASKYIELTEDEQLAILYHNGLYSDFKYEIQGRETPLYMILHFSDMWASRVIEK